MTMKRNILIADTSRLVAVRLFRMLEGINNVGQIFHTVNYEDMAEFIKIHIVDVILLDSGFLHEGYFKIMQSLNGEVDGKSLIIVMCDPGNDKFYRDFSPATGGNHFIDKFRDFEKIPEIISALN